jgi:hypothetical protein
MDTYFCKKKSQTKTCKNRTKNNQLIPRCGIFNKKKHPMLEFDPNKINMQMDEFNK